MGLGDGVKDSMELLYFTIIDLKSLGENREEARLPARLGLQVGELSSGGSVVTCCSGLPSLFSFSPHS